MFVKNYYIYCLRRQGSNNTSGSYTDYNGKTNCLSGFTSVEEFKGLRYPNGKYELADLSLSYSQSANGIGVANVKYGNDVVYIPINNSNTSTPFTNITDNSNSSNFFGSSVYNYSNKPFFRVGAGITNDSTPVSLDDYKVDNMLFDDVLSITQSASNGGIYTLFCSNITASDVTIRQVGAYVVPGYFRSNDYDTSTDPFNVYTSNSNSYPCLLIWKVKLTTPIIIPANGSKNITVEFVIPQ